jgi:hypothetical protein
MGGPFLSRLCGYPFTNRRVTKALSSETSRIAKQLSKLVRRSQAESIKQRSGEQDDFGSAYRAIIPPTESQAWTYPIGSLLDAGK